MKAGEPKTFGVSSGKSPTVSRKKFVVDYSSSITLKNQSKQTRAII